MAATFNNGEARLYIDGDLVTLQKGMRIPQVSETTLSLGREKALNGFTGKFYEGLMDEVRIWDVTRTRRQIRRAMNKRISPTKVHLVAYWRMDEGTGDTALDVTGKGHDMQLGDAVGPDAADPTWVTPGRL